MNKTPLIDRLLSHPFPGWACRRALARLGLELANQRRAALIGLSTYEAAEKSRNTADWLAKNKSADNAILGDAATLLARSRAAVRDDWAARSLVDGHVRHVVGTGINVRAAAFDLDTKKPLSAFNAQADWWFKRWARDPKFCDMERKKCFMDIQGLAISESIQAGQSFCVMSYRARPDMVGLVLQMFETEQLDVSKFKNPDNGNEIKRGIEVNEYDAAVAYWVYMSKHPLDSYGTKSERVPASRVLHLMHQDRPRQTHGVTRMAAVLRDLWHNKMYDEYVILRARFEACGGATIESELGGGVNDLKGLLAASDETDSGLDAKGNDEMRFEPNMLWKLPPGKKAVFHDPKVPTSQHAPFSRYQTTKIAAGGGLDYPTVSRDFSGNTFSGQRQGMLENWMETDPQQIRLVNLWLRPIYESFITYAIMEARLPAPLFYDSMERRAAYLEAIYQPQGKKWIDPANQAAAAKIDVENKFRTHKAVIDERDGGDWRETFDDVQEVEQAATARNIFLPSAQAAKPKSLPQEPRP